MTQSLPKKKNLYAHLRNIHGDRLLNFECTVCNKTFKVQRTLDIHLKKYHSNDEEKRETRIICPLCNELLYKFSKLKIHLFEKHEFTVEITEISFSSIAGNIFFLHMIKIFIPKLILI